MMADPAPLSIFENLRTLAPLISATAQPFSTLCYELDDIVHKSDVQLHRQSYAFNNRRWFLRAAIRRSPFGC